ncbi:MAG: hypothetical protein QOG48_333 [Verrucomicrobiota bacterium]
MKKIFCMLAAAVALMPTSDAMDLNAKVWATLEKTDVATLSKNIDAHIGRLVEVRCDFRGKDIHHLKPSWYEGSIWQTASEGEKGFSHVRVMLSKNDLNAFKSLPTSGGGGGITLYGKILRDSEANFVFVKLIGRNAVVDPSGKAKVTW